MATRTSVTEPFALTRPTAQRETFADWFAHCEARLSRWSSERLSFATAEPAVVVRGANELSPAVAGAITGAVAGPAMVGVAMALSARAHHAIDLPAMMARAAHAPDAWLHTAGWTMAVVAGAAFGALFARITRRLRSFAPMLAFAMIAAFSLWTMVHGLVLTRLTPSLAKMLPYGPMVIGAVVAGAILALEVPIRTRRVV